MIDKIKELRKVLPIPIGEAKQLLMENEGDVEKCIYLFKAKSLNEIQDITGCDEKMANEYYEIEKCDFNRTVSAIREAIYDRNYKPINGVTKESVSLIYQWLRIIETDDFGRSLDFNYLNTVIDKMLLIPSLIDTANTIRKAKDAKDIIFDGYSDSSSLDEFVRRHKRLDDSEEFQEADKIINLRITIIKEELMRHARNL
ncbi:MAG: hypothetical protein LBU84_13440 [Prevotella sp.]|jgi:hypothetical protein|nr:hypothetical protein [Prevotella sp.]